ncbi:MAG: polyketide cyclase [Citrobacter freundii]|nr:MAG: polyketide cyclase [Citrobacter freundii]
MNIILAILIVIVSLIVLLLIIGLFTKRHYAVSREIVINKPVEQVFDYLRLQKNQEQFNKWVMTDPNKKVEIRGIDGTVGSVYTWSGNKQAGEGEVEIMQLKENQQIDTQVRFVRPFTSSANITFLTTPVSSGQTRIHWGFTSTMKYPMNIMLVLMGMEKLLGRDMEKSLGNLKTILEG